MCFVTSCIILLHVSMHVSRHGSCLLTWITVWLYPLLNALSPPHTWAVFLRRDTFAGIARAFAPSPKGTPTSRFRKIETLIRLGITGITGKHAGKHSMATWFLTSALVIPTNDVVQLRPCHLAHWISIESQIAPWTRDQPFTRDGPRGPPRH